MILSVGRIFAFAYSLFRTLSTEWFAVVGNGLEQILVNLVLLFFLSKIILSACSEVTFIPFIVYCPLQKSVLQLSRRTHFSWARII